MKAPLSEFKQNITKMCIIYHYTLPLNEINAVYLEYYNSPLGELETKHFTQLIDKAKNCIRTNSIPQISELVNLIPSLNTEYPEYDNPKGCPRCKGTGFVTMIAPDGYEYTFTCDCEKGQFKHTHSNWDKKKPGGCYCKCYKEGLLHGYKIKEYDGNLDDLTEKEKVRALNFLDKYKKIS